MNHLSGVEHLANRFIVMRHGQSKANADGVIVSRIETDRDGDYGLTELGAKQAQEAAQACGLPAATVICSSDFSRARQTAEIVRAQLGVPELIIAPELRERYFGDWDGTPVANYARVWQADTSADRGEGDYGAANVETADAVLDRTSAFVAELDRRFSDREILLVSHGDTLQILQAGFQRMDPSRHRSVPPLGTAEIRRLTLG